MKLAETSTVEDIQMLYHKHKMSSRSYEGYLLLKNFGDIDHKEATEVMNSMRDVEVESSLKIIGGDD